jgi:hypothetical protein
MTWISPHSRVAWCLVVFGVGSVPLSIARRALAQNAVPPAWIESVMRVKRGLKIEIAIPMGVDGVEIYRRRDSYASLDGKKIPDSTGEQAVWIATVMRDASSMQAWYQDRSADGNASYAYKVRSFMTEKVKRRVKYRRKMVEVEVDEKRFSADSPEKSFAAAEETSRPPLVDSTEALLKASRLRNDLKAAVALGSAGKAQALLDEWHRYRKSDSWNQVEPRFAPMVKVLEDDLAGMEEAMRHIQSAGESPVESSSSVALSSHGRARPARQDGLVPVSSEYDFTPQGPISVGSSTWCERGAIRFTNQGSRRIRGRLVYLEGPFFAEGHSQNKHDAWADFSLEAKESVEFRVQFNPRTDGLSTGRLTVEADGSSSQISIALRGRGERQAMLSKKR